MGGTIMPGGGEEVPVGGEELLLGPGSRVVDAALWSLNRERSFLSSASMSPPAALVWISAPSGSTGCVWLMEVEVGGGAVMGADCAGGCWGVDGVAEGNGG